MRETVITNLESYIKHKTDFDLVLCTEFVSVFFEEFREKHHSLDVFSPNITLTLLELPYVNRRVIKTCID